MSHPFTPAPQQAEAIKAIKHWYTDPKSDQVFYLAGYAGTGKSSCTHYTIDDLGLDIDEEQDVLFGAYAGKAALVMRRNGMINASTIHRLIYTPVEDQETGKVSFILKYDESPLHDTKLVVLDECSMIDSKMKADLLSFGKKVLVLGDPGQLDPINGPPAFTKPNVFLTDIHRQAQDSPIILVSMLARLGEPLPYGDYGDVRIIRGSEIDIDELSRAEQVITGKNATRKMLNEEIKNYLGFTNVYPDKPGAKLICLKNNHQVGLLNGMIMWTADKQKFMSKKNKFFTQSLVDDEQNLFEDLDIATAYFDGRDMTEKEENDLRRSKTIQLFDYGFCCTVHKSQGSQWDEVYVYDDGFGLWDMNLRRKFMYTAITRAAKKLVIIRG